MNLYIDIYFTCHAQLVVAFFVKEGKNTEFLVAYLVVVCKMPILLTKLDISQLKETFHLARLLLYFSASPNQDQYL